MKYGSFFCALLLIVGSELSLSGQTLSLSTFTTLPAIIDETSGLAANSRNQVWTHNDSGGLNQLYEVDTTGTLIRTITITNASNVDWEELTQDDQGNFYVGDFGNNNNTRTNQKIYKIPNPDSVSTNNLTAEILNLSYADQTAFPPASNHLDYDMEAMIWFEGHLYLFSKNRTNPFDGYTRLYKLADTAGTYSVTPIDSFYTGPGPKEVYWVTGADISPSGQQLVLLSYDKLWLFSCFSGDNFFGGNVQQLAINALGQYEGVKFIDETTLYISNETSPAGTASLHRLDLSPYVNVPIVDLGQDINTLSNSVSLNAGIQTGNSVLWSNGATSSQITVLSSGTYWVRVMDGNCVASDTIVVNLLCETFASGVNASDISCFGAQDGSIDLMVVGGTPGYTYTWSNGATTQDLSNLGAGTYSVTLSDQNGCTRQQSLSISEPSPLVLNATTTNVLCNGYGNGFIDLNPSGGTPGYSVNWSNGATTEDLSSLVPGTYIVNLQDVNNCSLQDTFQISEPPALQASVQATPTLCFGEASGAVSLSVSGGTPGYSINWSNGDTSLQLNNVPAGNYVVSISDIQGCTRSDTAVVEDALPIGIAINPQNPSCPGLADGAIDLIVVGGTPPYTYLWSNGDTTQDLSQITAGDYSFSVIDLNGCERLDSISLSAPPAPQWSLQSADLLCAGDMSGSISLTISGGTAPFSYQWSNGDTTASISQLPGGTFSLLITDSLHCTFVDSVSLMEPMPLLIDNLVSTPDSNGVSGTIQLSVSGGTPPYQFLWSNGATDSLLSGLAAGTYSVSISDANACMTADSVVVAFEAPTNALESLQGIVQLNLYPNPADQEVRLWLTWDQPQAVRLALYNTAGQTLWQQSLAAEAQQQSLIDLRNLPAGLYWLKIMTAKGSHTERIMVIR